MLLKGTMPSFNAIICSGWAIFNFVVNVLHLWRKTCIYILGGSVFGLRRTTVSSQQLNTEYFSSAQGGALSASSSKPAVTSFSCKQLNKQHFNCHPKFLVGPIYNSTISTRSNMRIAAFCIVFFNHILYSMAATFLLNK